MRKILLSLVAIVCVQFSQAQLLSWSPQFPNDNSTINITMDATKGNQALLGFTGAVYMHLGVITNLSTTNTDWRYVPTTWGTTTAPAATSLGNNKWAFTINNPRTYFNAASGGVPAGETILRVALLFRNADGSKAQKNADGSDMYIPIYPVGANAIQFTTPFIVPTFNIQNEAINIATGQTLATTAVASISTGSLELYLNGSLIQGPLNAANTISASPTISNTGNQQLVAVLTVGANKFYDTINFYVTPPNNIAALPAGVKEGINFGANCNTATLVLYAPNKSNVVVLGDFPGSNWQPQTQYQMNKTPDGNYYWITLNNLVSGTEYAFNYLVDNSIYIADPYSEKILDPYNDQFIPSTTYPGLKPYPTNANVSPSRNGFVSVLQTCAPTYTWQTNNFTKPDARNLITYELLIRDFGDARNYQMLIDTMSYFRRLGINAIELMPVNEFSGNESWGYNPTFYCALDKAYGTKNKFKEFIDTCHRNGIAVILDVVYNHLDAYNTPQGRLYWDAATGKPAANSPWFNQTAPHPYSVFEDLNHTSTATQYLVNRALEYWLSEYKVDGYRIDLAKGFTQTQTNTTTVENYDASRVANLNRYYDYVIPRYPGTYMILEFLGQQRQEEQEYATKGFLLWGNNNGTYNTATKGFGPGSNFSKIVYNSNEQSFTTPSEMGYMESHDEERLMYRNLNEGASSGSYNVRNLATALDRQAAAAAVFFTVPGPKMIWQFGERGYDLSINFGGSNLANKPPRWEYMTEPDRLKLYDAYSKLIRLRLSNPSVFNNTTFSYDFFDNNGLFKRFQIADPASTGMQVTVVANLDVVTQTRTVNFQSTGGWLNYLSNGTVTGLNGPSNTTFTITNTAQTITLLPGEYHVYVKPASCTVAAPVVTSPVTYCQNATASALTATGTGLLWYSTASGGTGSATAPVPSTATAGSTTYYVSQTSGCEGPRASIVVNVTASTVAPTIISPVTYCQNAPATALTATGMGLLWYTAATGGTGVSTAPTPSTSTAGSTTYYVSQTGTCGEGPRAAIVVNVNALPAAPVVVASVGYCQGATASPLNATGTNLLWYSTATGGGGIATTPTPSTTNAGSSTYYVSQTVNGCEGPRSSILVTVTAIPTAPIVVSPISYCQNATALALTATGNNLLWYTTATGGTGSATAPIPSTTTIGSTNYYVSQSNNGCESPRATIQVDITTSTPAPVVTSPINYCQNTTAMALTATGTSLLWYTNATGGTGVATAPVPSTSTAGTFTYYVSQTTTCGEGPRSAIVVNVNAIPAPPVVVSPVNYCQNTTAVPLSATGTNLLWYSTPSGGGGISTTPTPSTNLAGTSIYYVSQTVNGCESPRTTISVTITATPAVPTVTTPVTYCQNATAIALTATGSNLFWYSSATGGTGSSTAPVPSTTTVGSTSYYVSQTNNGCEGPRATITVAVNPATVAPVVVSPINYCQNATATALTATGSNLLWYSTATGGGGVSTAPTPSTTSAGTVTYYVSQTGACGEGPRAAIMVNVNATPSAPVVVSPVTYCQNATASALAATGTNLLWYATATGGTGNGTAPVPVTTSAGTITYYVSQTINGCEGPRASILVQTNATPTAPVVVSPVTYCQNATASALTATGSNLLWYSGATGGAGNGTAPIPSTSAAGATSYYVSQTINACEGPRAAIQVTINPLPVNPVVSSPINYCQNAVAVPLTATGTNLLWYTQATGGTGSTVAPTPSTNASGTISYYVSQSNSCGESGRTILNVITNPTPAAPSGLAVTGTTLNSAVLNWTAVPNQFYWVDYRVVGSSTWNAVVNGLATGQFTLTGLTSSTNYEWRVATNCEAVLAVNYSTGTFSTTSHNALITDIRDGLGLKISPNPVEGQALVDYLLPESGSASLTLYNMFGQQLQVLFSGTQPAGQYQLILPYQLKALPGGCYVIRLYQNGKGQSIRFIKK